MRHVFCISPESLNSISYDFIQLLERKKSKVIGVLKCGP